MKENVGMMAAGAPVFPWKRPSNVRLAHAYVPWQQLCGTMSPIQSLKAGTIFPELTGHYGVW